MSEDKKQRTISRAKRASLLMQDELLVEAFNTLQESYTKALFDSHYTESARRENIYLAFNTIEQVKKHLSIVMAAGNIEQAELDKLNSAPSR